MQGMEKPQGEAVMSRLERKFVFHPQLAEFIVAWLRHFCVVDPVYPVNLVTSLYFDTPDLDSYYECLNGDIYKNKVRIRWYESPAADQDTLVYIELKSKNGFQTLKRREQVKVPGSALQDSELANIVGKVKLERALQQLGYMPQKPLRPIIIISYRRYRLRVLQTGMSLTYDVSIASSMVEGSIAKWAPRLELKATVLELKGGTMASPEMFRGLRSIAFQWTTFSKYARCLASHLEQPGSYGWLESWSGPSGAN